MLPLKVKSPKGELNIDLMRESDYEQTMKLNAELLGRNEATMKIFDIPPEMHYESMMMHKSLYLGGEHSIVIRDGTRVVGNIIPEPLWNDDEGVTPSIDVTRYLNIHEMCREHWLKVV